MRWDSPTLTRSCSSSSVVPVRPTPGPHGLFVSADCPIRSPGRGWLPRLGLRRRPTPPAMSSAMSTPAVTGEMRSHPMMLTLVPSEVAEPSAAELDLIEAEMPVIEAEVALLDIEISLLDRVPSELDARRLERARRRVETARAAVAAHRQGVA